MQQQSYPEQPLINPKSLTSDNQYLFLGPTGKKEEQPHLGVDPGYLNSETTEEQKRFSLNSDDQHHYKAMGESGK